MRWAVLVLRTGRFRLRSLAIVALEAATSSSSRMAALRRRRMRFSKTWTRSLLKTRSSSARMRSLASSTLAPSCVQSVMWKVRVVFVEAMLRASGRLSRLPLASLPLTWQKWPSWPLHLSVRLSDFVFSRSVVARECFSTSKVSRSLCAFESLVDASFRMIQMSCSLLLGAAVAVVCFDARLANFGGSIPAASALMTASAMVSDSVACSTSAWCLRERPSSSMADRMLFATFVGPVRSSLSNNFSRHEISCICGSV